MKTNYVLFDFDGVIVDSFAPAFEVSKLICPHIDEEGYRRRFEGNINDWNENSDLHNDKCRHDIDFFTEYVPRMKNDVKIFSGMEGVIEQLSKNYNLIIVSSTISGPIKELLDKYGLSKYFIEIMGNDIHKSKVEKIKMIFRKYNINQSKCVFITDTLGDMREASQLGVETIGVCWGFHDNETLKKGHPFEIAFKPEELPHIILDFLKYNQKFLITK